MEADKQPERIGERDHALVDSARHRLDSLSRFSARFEQTLENQHSPIEVFYALGEESHAFDRMGLRESVGVRTTLLR